MSQCGAARLPAQWGMAAHEVWSALRTMPAAAWAVLALALVELALLALRPRWLARLAFLRLAPTRVVRVAPEVRVAAPAAGYRAPAIQVARTLPARVAMGDTVLTTSPVRGARSFAWGERRRLCPVRIELHWNDDGVRLDARMLPMPFVTPTALGGLFAALALLAPVWLVVVATGVALVALAGTVVQLAHARPTALERAYDALERALTRTA